MKLAGVEYESIVDGEGIRTTIFISGCLHGCEGCHNKETQDFDKGETFDESLQAKILEQIKIRPYIRGITLSGGDPMYSAKELIPFVERYKEEIGGDVWIYSGFKIEDILKNDIMKRLLELCDVLVDGKFEKSNIKYNLKYRGSSNQRIIDLRTMTDVYDEENE